MNKSVIRYILGNILKTEAFLMLLPCIVSIIYNETVGIYYAGVMLLSGCIGYAMTIKKPKDFVFYLKEGCIATSLSWIAMSLMGCLPFWLSGEIPAFIDALFETVSGFTTTGASILSDVEVMSHTATMWRCFTHWIGGMGVLVFLMAILPLSGGSNINLMKAESPGPSVGKLVPKMRHTARILYIIYIALTLIQLLLLIIGDMPVFEAVATSFATAGTGGFGIKNDSMMSYSPYIQWVVTIFMILCGVNFNAYYFILLKNIKKAFKIEEIRYYFFIIALSTGIIFINLLELCANALDALRHSLFQVASIITTTGFATWDFEQWTATSKMVLIFLMFIGACAGSTGGGIKVSRILLLFKNVGKELNSFIHPRAVKKVNMDGKPVEDEVVHSVNVYFITFMIIFFASIFLISFEGHSFTTNFTAVTACINNIGPGLEGVGPTQNFGFFSIGSKFVLIFDMLAGRLELFPLLIMFHPHVIKEGFTRRKNRRE